MSTYTVNTAADKAVPAAKTPVRVPTRLRFNGTSYVAAPESLNSSYILELHSGVVLPTDVGSYLAALYPSLITVT